MKKLTVLALLLTPFYFAFSGGDGSHVIHAPAPVHPPLEIDINVQRDGDIDVDLENLTAHELDHIIAALHQHRALDVELTLPRKLEREYKDAAWTSPHDSPLAQVVDVLARNGITWDQVKVD